MPKAIISLTEGRLSESRSCFTAPLNFRLEEGEHLVLTGPNGSGKTTLVETLLGRHALCSGRLEYGCSMGEIRYIAFQETYNRAEDGEYYYQQRWNSCDSDLAPRVEELLGRLEGDEAWRAELYELFAIGPMLDKRVIMLSSGELRKFQLVRMLLTRARVLVVDNPFIGLDTAARALLEELFERLTRWGGLQLVVVQPDGEAIPVFATHVYRLADGQLSEKFSAARFRPVVPASVWAARPLPAAQTEPLTCDEMVTLRDVTIRYGDRTILQSLDWTLRPGEQWLLTGPNGAGKSTLLSLISADNPQAYAQDITLFGRRRGTGESIWEIKRHIGYVSSELQGSFRRDIPVERLVASGYYDTLGLYETPTPDQLAAAVSWMGVFGLEGLCGRSFLQLSSGEQRLALLARAFVKDPDLLILDEPLNGLDGEHKGRVKGVIEAFCRRAGKALIYVSHREEDYPSSLTHRLDLGSWP